MPPAPPAGLRPDDLFTASFVLVLVLGLVVKFWLASRQIRHVARHRAQVPTAFADTVALHAHQKAADYTVVRSRFGLLETAYGALVLLGWTLLGGLDALNQALLQWLGAGMVQQITLLASFAAIGGVLELPWSLYQTFVIEQRFGFNRTTWRLWCTDLLKSGLVGAVVGLPIAALILWLMGAGGPWWWLWAWGAWMAFNLLLLMVYPNVIAPLFNQFKPLENEALKTRVSALMQRCGFAAKGLFVMDGSRRSAHANAYFTGFGTAKRVVFYDTLLARLSPPQVDAVLAHELGHFTHRHILQRIVAMFALSLAGFALLGWLSGQTWFYIGLGVTPNLAWLADGRPAPNAALALLLFLLALPVYGYFVSPISAQLSRRHEFQADAFAVRQTSSTDLSGALLKLYEDNASTLTPDPLFVRFYYSHPPASERLARMAQATA